MSGLEFRTALPAILRLAGVVAVILAINFAMGALIDRHLPMLDPMLREAWADGRMVWVALAYALLLAIPCVPGVEIGLAMLALFGAQAALLVWGATVSGLTLSYLAGRLMPVVALVAALRRLGARGLANDIESAGTLTGIARSRALLRHAPTGAARMILRHNGLALAVLFNLPGNALIGGGGGIALIAGLSRIYSVARFVLVTALAVAPVPFVVWVFGTVPFATP